MTDPQLPPQGAPQNLPPGPPPGPVPPPPGVAPPGYNERIPQYPSPYVGQPVYGAQPPGYQFPYQPKTGLRGGAKVGIWVGAGCLVLGIIPLIIIVVIFVVSLSVGSQYASPTYESSSAPDDADSGTGDLDSGTTTADSPEAEWKSGVDWLPAPVETESQPNAFLPGYATPEEWLATTGGVPAGFDVVFTSDPTYNCGLSKAPKNSDWVVGCYNPDYGQTLFLWWGPDAVDDMKELILLHEYSHFYQNWTNYDSTHSASLDGLYDDPEFVQDVWETDATCRVYYDWGYTSLQYLDSYTVSPCGATDWSDDWIDEQIEARGVTIEDW